MNKNYPCKYINYCRRTPCKHQGSDKFCRAIFCNRGKCDSVRYPELGDKTVCEYRKFLEKQRLSCSVEMDLFINKIRDKMIKNINALPILPKE